MAIATEEEKMIGLAAISGIADRASDTPERKSEKKMLQTAIGQLPGTDAQIITLYYQHEQSLDEIGTVMGLTSNHVKVKLFRARQRLREILQKQFPKEIMHL